MKRLFTLTLVVLLVCRMAVAAEDQPLLQARDQDKLGKLFATYFAARKESDTKRIVKAYEALKKEFDARAKGSKVETLLVSPVDMRAIFATPIDPAKSVKKGLVLKHDFEETIMSGARKFEYLLRIPKDYKDEKAYPVVLFMHPDEMPEDELKKWVEKFLPTDVMESAIILAPRKGKEDSWTSGSGQMSAFFALNKIREAYHVDGMRIFLDGAGSSAGAVVETITSFPGYFVAGILRDMTAVAESPMLVNASHTPMLLLSPASGDTAKVMSDFADAAKASDLSGVELVQTTLEATGAPGDAGAAALTRFFADTRKQVAPEKLKFTTTTPFFSCYWLQLINVDASQDKPITVEAQVDRAANEIRVTTPPGVYAFTVYLNDALLDLGKTLEIKHTVVGEPEGDGAPLVRFKGTKPPNLDKALSLWFNASNGNSGEVYTNYVEVEVPD